MTWATVLRPQIGILSKVSSVENDASNDCFYMAMCRERCSFDEEAAECSGSGKRSRKAGVLKLRLFVGRET